MKIPKQPLKVPESDVICRGVFALCRKKRGRGYMYYLDNASSPDDDVVFLVYDEEWDNWYVLDADKDIWYAEIEYGSSTLPSITQRFGVPHPIMEHMTK